MDEDGYFGNCREPIDERALRKPSIQERYARAWVASAIGCKGQSDTQFDPAAAVAALATFLWANWNV